MIYILKVKKNPYFLEKEPCYFHEKNKEKYEDYNLTMFLTISLQRLKNSRHITNICRLYAPTVV